MTAAHALARRLPRLPDTDASACSRLLTVLAAAGLPARSADSDSTETSRWRIALESDLGPLEFGPIRANGRSVAIGTESGSPDLVAAGEALAACEPLIASIERALGSPLWTRAVRSASPASAERIEVCIESHDGLCALLGAPATALRRLPRPRWGRPPPHMVGVGVRCRVAIGGCTLAADLLAAAAPGDLLLETRRHGPAWTVRVRTPDGSSVKATLLPASRSLRFDSEDPVAMEPDSPEHGPAMTAADPPSWPHVPTDVRFELPGVTVPLGVIAGLQPGAVLRIADADAPLRVEVIAGGRPIGRGELVVVGDAFGVRLLERTDGGP
jgi:type III secretion system YscQ/HrcQ family protein